MHGGHEWPSGVGRRWSRHVYWAHSIQRAGSCQRLPVRQGARASPHDDEASVYDPPLGDRQLPLAAADPREQHVPHTSTADAIDASEKATSAQQDAPPSNLGRHVVPEFVEGDTVEECEGIDHEPVSKRQEP